MNSYIIRKLNVSDYEKYLNLINQFRSTIFTLEEYKETLSKIEKNSTIWVIDDNNELIGTTTIIYEYLENFYKKSGLEKKGIQMAK